MGLFIRADAQLFTGAMQAMAPLDASSGFLMCFRSFARHRADVATRGALALGGFFALDHGRNALLTQESSTAFLAVSEKKTGGRRCGAGSAMKYDQAPYMHCTNLGWLV